MMPEQQISNMCELMCTYISPTGLRTAPQCSCCELSPSHGPLLMRGWWASITLPSSNSSKLKGS